MWLNLSSLRGVPGLRMSALLLAAMLLVSGRLSRSWLHSLFRSHN